MAMCPARVTEVKPATSPPKAEFVGRPGVAKLLGAEIQPGFPAESMRSPDGTLILILTQERSWFNQETEFFGVTMEEADTRKRFPVLSFWASSGDSGIALGLKWSEGSDAIRFTGSTRGFERSQEAAQSHQVDLLLDTKTLWLYQLHASSPASAGAASPSNYVLNASVRPFTPLAEGASGAPVRPARYHWR